MERLKIRIYDMKAVEAKEELIKLHADYQIFRQVKATIKVEDRLERHAWFDVIVVLNQNWSLELRNKFETFITKKTLVSYELL